VRRWTLLLWLRGRQLHVDLYTGNAFHGFRCGAYFAHQCARIILIEQKLDVDLGVFVDVDFLDLLIFDNALTGARVFYQVERCAHARDKSLTI
jgi:hypothetical protein